MKVIAIVNLPFDVDLDKEDAYFVMRDGKYCQMVCLRPLPQRKLEWDWGSGARDWNACLDEILGETE